MANVYSGLVCPSQQRSGKKDNSEWSESTGEKVDAIKLFIPIIEKVFEKKSNF